MYFLLSLIPATFIVVLSRWTRSNGLLSANSGRPTGRQCST